MMRVALKDVGPVDIVPTINVDFRKWNARVGDSTLSLSIGVYDSSDLRSWS